MYKKFIVPFFALAALVFITVFGMTTYRYYQAIHMDDPITPYLSVESGKAIITRGDIAIDLIAPESYDIREGDSILNATGSQSIVFWPDHSTTRLSSGSHFTIERMRIADDYSQIELFARLESGKAWSNIVRTLYPNSRIEFRLPKTRTIAGVRGTIFEVDADTNSVNAIEHKVTLSGEIGSGITLLPGQGANTESFKKTTKSGSDNIWRNSNQSFDTIQNTKRTSQMRESYDILAGSSDIWAPIDSSVRGILAQTDTFKNIVMMEAIENKDIEILKNLPEESLMKLYQQFQYKDFIQERDLLRGALLKASGSYIDTTVFRKSLLQGALYDMSDFSGMTLIETQEAIEESRELALEMQEMQRELEIEMQEMQEEMRLEALELQAEMEADARELEAEMAKDAEDMRLEAEADKKEREQEVLELQTELEAEARAMQLEAEADKKEIENDAKENL